MVDLPDANIWVSLIDEGHVHHRLSAQYWDEHAGVIEIVFTRVTMLALLRLSTSPHVLRDPLSPSEAWATYRKFLSVPNIRFMEEPQEVTETYAALTEESNLPHRLWTDAYLAAFALSAGCRLISFDTDFKRFPGLDFLLLE